MFFFLLIAANSKQLSAGLYFKQKMESRSKNFTEEDINILLALVKEKSYIVECKQADKCSASAKDEAWKEIEEDFNATTTGPKRNKKVLRKKYFNLKADLKKRSTAEKRSLYENDGGPPIKQQKEFFDDVLKEIVPGKQIEELPANYDCAYLVDVVHQDESRCIKEEEILCDSWIKPSAVSLTSAPTKYFKPLECYDPKTLRSEQNKRLNLDKTNNVNKTSSSKMVEIKSKWTEKKLSAEIEAFKEEHKLRMAQMTAEHDMRLCQMAEMHELKMQCLREKHQKEMKVLDNKCNEGN